MTTRSISLMPTKGTTGRRGRRREVAAQQRWRRRPARSARPQRQRDQRDDDERVEDDRRQDRALRARQPHDVERAEAADRRRRTAPGGSRSTSRRRWRSRRWSARRGVISSCLPTIDDLDQLGRVAVEVDHVAGLLARPACRCSSRRRHRPGPAPARRSCRRRTWRPACPRPAPRGSAPASFSGVASARKSSTPASAAMAAAVSGLSPVIITVRMPMRRSSAKRSRMPGLTMSLRWMTPSSRLSVGDDQRRAAGAWRSARPSSVSSGGAIRVAAPVRAPRRPRPCAARCRPSRSTPRKPGLRGERDDLGDLRPSPSAAAERLARELDDRAALRASRRPARRAARPRPARARRRPAAA